MGPHLSQGVTDRDDTKDDKLNVQGKPCRGKRRNCNELKVVINRFPKETTSKNRVEEKEKQMGRD